MDTTNNIDKIYQRPHPTWIDRIFFERKYKQRYFSQIRLEYPLDYEGNMTSIDFISWANAVSKNNPTIYIIFPIDINQCTIIIDQIYKTIGKLHVPKCTTIQRKMYTRYKQTGFPLTIKTKCIHCNNYVLVTKNYIKYLCKSRIVKSEFIPKQLYCTLCKNMSKQKSVNDLIGCFEKVSINDSMMID